MWVNIAVYAEALIIRHNKKARSVTGVVFHEGCLSSWVPLRTAALSHF